MQTLPKNGMNFLLVHDESFDFDGVCHSQIPAKCNNIFIKGYNRLFYLFDEIFFCLNGGFALKISLMHHLLHFA